MSAIALAVFLAALVPLCWLVGWLTLDDDVPPRGVVDDSVIATVRRQERDMVKKARRFWDCSVDEFLRERRKWWEDIYQVDGGEG